jgi:branched-subunit amino acid transport protein
MQVHVSYILLFLGMMVVTFLPRVLPLTILSKMTMPKFVIDVLNYLPVAILGALLMPTVLLKGGSIDISLNNLYLIAAIITTIVSIITKKLFVIVIAGIFAMYLLINFL